jgi:hypothetical protein
VDKPTNIPEINRTSRDWMLVEAWVAHRLAQHRTTLESVQCDEHKSTLLRGRIAELKLLLELANGG